MKKIHESKNSKKFNATINKVHEEMEYVEKVASEWRVKWDETYSQAYCYDLQFLIEDEIAWLESMYDRKYDLTNGGDEKSRVGAALVRETLVDENEEEYVVEFRKIEWLLRNSKIGRLFTFVNDGDISYSQVKRNRKVNDDSLDYYAKYNVNNNSLDLRFVSNDGEISCSYEGDSRVLSYMNVPITEDSQGLMIKISGKDGALLVVNVNPMGIVDNRILSFDGNTYIICNNEIVEASVNEDESTLEITDELKERVISCLNTQFINISDEDIMDFVENAKKALVNAIKSVKNDVPLKGLARRMDVLLTMVNAKGNIVDKKDNKQLKRK